LGVINNILNKTNTYFASDFHLGVDLAITSKTRERIVVSWLESIRSDAKTIYLVGDIFDYWFEYKKVIPKGYVRLFGKLAELSDEGIDIHYFKGNHDMWIYTYFQEELGLIVHDHEVIHQIDGASFFVAHGDGLGKGDNYYKFIKSILRNRVAQWLYSIIHPTIGLPLMQIMSGRSRHHTGQSVVEYDNIKSYAEVICNEKNIDFFISGHNHNPIQEVLSNGSSVYCNLGDWMSYFTYARWNGKKLKLEKYNYNLDA